MKNCKFDPEATESYYLQGGLGCPDLQKVEKVMLPRAYPILLLKFTIKNQKLAFYMHP